MVSGKKEIFEDGILVFSSSAFSISEFSHGWTSNGCIFRVEALVGFSSDHTYTFTIDGVPFNTWSERTYSGNINNNNGNINNYDDTGRNSYSSNDFNQQSSPNNNNNNVQRSSSPFEPFDPFQASGQPTSNNNNNNDNTAAFDPFSSGGSSQDVFGQSNNTTTASRSSANLFDPFASSPAPTQRSSESTSASAPAPASTPQTSTDPFNLSSVNDVFGGTPQQTTSTPAVAAPDFSGDIFGSGSTPTSNAPVVNNNNNNNNSQSLSNQINDIFSSNTTNSASATNNVFGAFPAPGQSMMAPSSFNNNNNNNNVFNDFNAPVNNSYMMNSGYTATMNTVQGNGMSASGGNPFQTGSMSQQQKKNTTFDNLVSWDK